MGNRNELAPLCWEHYNGVPPLPGLVLPYAAYPPFSARMRLPSGWAKLFRASGARVIVVQTPRSKHDSSKRSEQLTACFSFKDGGADPSPSHRHDAGLDDSRLGMARRRQFGSPLERPTET